MGKSPEVWFDPDESSFEISWISLQWLPRSAKFEWKAVINYHNLRYFGRNTGREGCERGLDMLDPFWCWQKDFFYFTRKKILYTFIHKRETCARHPAGRCANYFSLPNNIHITSSCHKESVTTADPKEGVWRLCDSIHVRFICLSVVCNFII